MNLKDLNKYYLSIICLYLIVVPVLVLKFSETLNYSIGSSDWLVTVVIFLGSVALFFITEPIFRFGKISFIKLSLFHLLILIAYAAIFAFAEEFIFRGVIQGFLQQSIEGLFLPIILSSLIFASAHLPNGATGWRLREWNWEFFALTFIGGLALGLSFTLTRSLMSPTILHFLFIIGLRVFRRKN